MPGADHGNRRASAGLTFPGQKGPEEGPGVAGERGRRFWSPSPESGCPGCSGPGRVEAERPRGQ